MLQARKVCAAAIATTRVCVRRWAGNRPLRWSGGCGGRTDGSRLEWSRRESEAFIFRAPRYFDKLA